MASNEVSGAGRFLDAILYPMKELPVGIKRDISGFVIIEPPFLNVFVQDVYKVELKSVDADGVTVSINGVDKKMKLVTSETKEGYALWLEIWPYFLEELERLLKL